jgi:hypothetical protein
VVVEDMICGINHKQMRDKIRALRGVCFFLVPKIREL